MKPGILVHFISTEFLAYDRNSVSKGLCKGGRDWKRSSEELTYWMDMNKRHSSLCTSLWWQPWWVATSNTVDSMRGNQEIKLDFWEDFYIYWYHGNARGWIHHNVPQNNERMRLEPIKRSEKEIQINQSLCYGEKWTCSAYLNLLSDGMHWQISDLQVIVPKKQC